MDAWMSGGVCGNEHEMRIGELDAIYMEKIKTNHRWNQYIKNRLMMLRRVTFKGRHGSCIGR